MQFIQLGGRKIYILRTRNRKPNRVTQVLSTGALIAGCFLSAGTDAQSVNVPVDLVHYPEFIFYNGQVLTADADTDFTIAEAVAVRGNRIFKVGKSAEIRRLVGPSTRAIDLRGRSVTPGFIYNDADNAVPAGDILKDSQWNGMTYPHLGGATIDQALLTLARIVELEGKSGEPIFFNLQDQWAAVAMKAWGISTLDEVAPENPVAVYLDSSYGILNTAMIDLAIERGFPADHFHIDRDENGDYTGVAGAQLVGFVGREIRPWPDPEWFDQVAIPGAIKTLAEYASNGITVATGHMSAPTMTVLNRIFHEQPEKMAIRVYPGLDFLRQNPNGEMYLKRMGNLVDFSLSDNRGEMVTIVGASVGPHSGSEDAAASLLSIYPKKHVIPEISPNTHGYNRWTSQWFTDLSQEDLTGQQQRQTDYYNVMLARRYGWNVTGIHNRGSEGIRLAMQNVMEAENQENLYVKKLWRPQGFDHNVEWVPEVYDYYDARPELKELIRFGVSVSSFINQRDAEPLGIRNVTEAQYGIEGVERLAPLKTLQDRGIPFHIEGGGPSSPMRKIQEAVTRIDRDGRVIAPHEALDRKSAFLALTRWPARFIGAENDMGSIQPGMLADLVVFDGNILEVPIDKLAELKPVLTLVGGSVAFESQEL
ncbi:MAG: amidohydrolase family protein [Gammaproteobacteria bacterium]|nr:amidohydrolase family protein [Gammaproteobacteria bacterium]